MKLGFIFFLTFLLSGCLLTHDDVREEIESEVAIQKQKNEESYKTVQGGVFSVQAKVSEMEDSLRELRGQIDLLLNKQEAQEQWNQDIQKQVEELNNNLNTTIQNLEEQVTLLTENLEQQKEEAKKLMENDPEYHFKVAEDFFNEEDWKKAIVSYERYREKNKSGKFFKKATFQIGQCFHNLDMKKEARVFFKEVVSSFPKSEEAKQAKKLLNVSTKKQSSSSEKKPVKKTTAKKTPKKPTAKKTVEQ